MARKRAEVLARTAEEQAELVKTDLACLAALMEVLAGRRVGT
jgi:hypothetical protein